MGGVAQFQPEDPLDGALMNKPKVIRRVELPSADAVSALEQHGVSTVHEAQGRIGLLASYIRPIYPGTAVAGHAVTVSLPPGVHTSTAT